MTEFWGRDAELARIKSSLGRTGFCCVTGRRRVHKGSSRYWESDTELDLVVFQTESKRLLVAECKWRDMEPNEEKGLLERLRLRFEKTRLAAGHRDVDFRLFSKRDLPRLSRLEE